MKNPAKHSPSKVIIAGLVLVVMTGLGIMLSQIKGGGGSLNLMTSNKSFSDEETVLSFNYPASWGQIKTNQDFYELEAARDFTFSKRPEIELIASTLSFSKETDFRENYIFGTIENDRFSFDLKAYCDYQTNQGVGKGAEENNTGGLDRFRWHGKYAFGECTNSEGMLYSASNAFVTLNLSLRYRLNFA